MAYRLVIIDDNPIAVQSLSQCFDWEQLGIEIAGTALDGIQGKELILRTHPDIVITDINMPDIDGLSMIEQVYEHLTTSKIIVSDPIYSRARSVNMGESVAAGGQQSY